MDDEAGVRRLGAYAWCVRDDGAVLLARMAHGAIDPGRWALPGGGVEPGEHPDDAVLRELLEETGLQGEHGSVVAVYSRTFDGAAPGGRPLHHVGLVYGVTLPDADAELTYEVAGSTDSCRWFSPEELADLPLTDLAAFAVGALLRPGPTGVSRP